MDATEQRTFLNLFAKHEFQKIAQKVFLIENSLCSIFGLTSSSPSLHAWGPFAQV